MMEHRKKQTLFLKPIVTFARIYKPNLKQSHSGIIPDLSITGDRRSRLI